MKTKLVTLVFVLFATISFAQAPIQNISTDSIVAYRLFSTNNTYTFINLNTRNGKMWQVQWSLEGDRFTTPLSLISLASEEEEQNGRFFLYPTINIYNFVLLDQIDGRTWQVQWSHEEKDRGVIPIY